MKSSEIWLKISIVVVGISLVLLGMKYFKQWKLEKTYSDYKESTTEKDVELNTTSITATETFEKRYQRLSSQMNNISILSMDESMHIGGYQLDVLDYRVTKNYENWYCGDLDSFTQDYIESVDENYNIISDEEYLAVDLKISPSYEYPPYVVEGETSELYMNCARINLFDKNENYITTYEPVGIFYENMRIDNPKSTYQIFMDYGEVMEVTLVFVDYEKVFSQYESPFSVFSFNVAGVVGDGISKDLYQGMVLDVEN